MGNDALNEFLDRLTEEIRRPQKEEPEENDFLYGKPKCCLCGDVIDENWLLNIKGNLMHRHCFLNDTTWLDRTEKYVNVSKSFPKHFSKPWIINGIEM